jgi:hypothetical protein
MPLTDGGPAHPNTLVIVNVDVIKKRVAAAEHMIFEAGPAAPFLLLSTQLYKTGKESGVALIQKMDGGR